MRNVFPLRRQAPDQPIGYRRGWVEGCAIGEREGRRLGRMEGAFAGLLLAVAIVAIVIYFGGVPS